MADVIKIKKGLDIHLEGCAEKALLKVEKSATYAVCPTDFDGITPRVTVKAGDRVKAGSVLMEDKNCPEIKFVSPVSGEVTAINRGEKRKLLSIVVTADDTIAYEEFDIQPLTDMKGGEVKQCLLAAGLWPFIKQRPYDMVANPKTTPRDIFVSTFDSSPLAPDFAFVLQGEEENFKTGLKALQKMTEGAVYLGVKNEDALKGLIQTKENGFKIVAFEGPHPAGNVGVQINCVKPINKGETVWTLRADDVLLIGRLFNKGFADFSRKIAVTGSQVTERGYADVVMGAEIKSILQGRVNDNGHLRYISGNVLTGTKVSIGDYLRAYHTQVTVIPEGNNVHEMLGWAMPRLNQFSTSRTYFSWLFGKKEYALDARVKGGKRAIIMSNDYDRVFPMNILPEYLLKAVIAFNIDKMEKLGIYEVAPEDFALCEFVDASKIEIQQIIREGLNKLYKELH